MNEQSPSDVAKSQAPENLPPIAAPTPVNPSAPVPASELTPEEQMEQFAKQLKEDDWGHQPC